MAHEVPSSPHRLTRGAAAGWQNLASDTHTPARASTRPPRPDTDRCCCGQDAGARHCGEALAEVSGSLKGGGFWSLLHTATQQLGVGRGTLQTVFSQHTGP